MNEPVSKPVEPIGIQPRGTAGLTVRAGRRWLTRAVVFVVLGYTAWCGCIYFVQDQLVFPREMAPSPAQAVPPYVQVMEVQTERGRVVPGWFIPAGPAVSGAAGPVVMFFHGNGEIIDYQDRIETLWRCLDVSLLLVEYRGYGRAKHAGEPSEAALVADGVAFFDALAARPDVDPKRIIIHGYSIGGGVAAQVAARRKPAALILESTFTSVAEFGWCYGVPPFLAKHPFRTDKVLPELGIPLFIAHGRRDPIVPVGHGRRLHAMVPDSTYIELDCGHFDLPGTGSNDAYVEQIRAFLIRAGALPMMTIIGLLPFSCPRNAGGVVPDAGVVRASIPSSSAVLHPASRRRPTIPRASRRFMQACRKDTEDVINELRVKFPGENVKDGEGIRR